METESIIWELEISNGGEIRTFRYTTEAKGMENFDVYCAKAKDAGNAVKYVSSGGGLLPWCERILENGDRVTLEAVRIDRPVLY